MAKRRTLSLLLKLAFSAATLVLFFFTSKVSFRDIGRTLGGVAWGWLAVAFSLHTLGLLFSAYRWRILIRAQGDDVPLSFLVKSYLVGTFFNNFLPTRFGGDVVRIWDGSKYSQSLVRSSAVVLVERATGIIVLFLFALVASLFRLDMARSIPIIWAALALGIVAHPEDWHMLQRVFVADWVHLLGAADADADLPEPSSPPGPGPVTGVA